MDIYIYTWIYIYIYTVNLYFFTSMVKLRLADTSMATLIDPDYTFDHTIQTCKKPSPSVNKFKTIAVLIPTNSTTGNFQYAVVSK